MNALALFVVKVAACSNSSALPSALPCPTLQFISGSFDHTVKLWSLEEDEEDG